MRHEEVGAFAAGAERIFRILAYAPELRSR